MKAREFLSIIVTKCPCYEAPLRGCALANLRRAPDRDGALKDLSEDAVDALVREHFVCVCRKEYCGT